MSDPKTRTIPLRLSPETVDRIAEAARLTGLAQSDLMRLAMAIGIEDLKKVNFDLAKLVSDAANPSESGQLRALRAAEEVREYHAESAPTPIKYPKGKRGRASS